VYKFDSYKKYLEGVGRGVLHFRTARYRKPRSNLGVFSEKCGISGIGGVDIILMVGGWVWHWRSDGS